jgi:MFS family permease
VTAATQAAVPVRHAWHRLATTAFFLGNGIAMGAWAANLPRLKEAQGLSDSALGAVLLAFGLGAVAAMPLAGGLAARLGAGRVAGGACLVLATLLPLPALAGSWPLLLAVGAALGMANGTVDVAMNAQASLVERRWGAAIMSSFHAGWSGGGLAGAALAGALAKAGWPLPAALALPALILAALGLCGLTSGVREAAAPRGPAFVLPSRALVGLCIIATLCFAAEGAVADWAGVYLRTELGTDAAWATSAYAAYSVAMALGRLSGDAVVRRLGPARVVRLGSLAAALALAVALLVPNSFAVDAALVVVGFGLSNTVPVVFSAAGHSQGTRGVAMAATLGYAGMLVAPPILGSIADAFGLRTSLALVATWTAAMALLAAAVAAGRPEPRHSARSRSRSFL